MKLPNARQARVQPEKITGYLLSENPAVGGGKPNFFVRFGFRPDNWREFADALLAVGREYDVIEIDETSFGIQYTVEGWIDTPDGRNPYIRTVWQIDAGSDYPRLGRVDIARSRLSNSEIWGDRAHRWRHPTVWIPAFAGMTG